MENLGIPLSRTLELSRLISAFTCILPAGFSYEGEQHPGWEFVFVNRGRARIRADEMTYVLKSGEMVCHKPMEFHSVTPYQGEAEVTIFCFTCAGEGMKYFNNKIMLLPTRQRQYIDDISEHAAHIFAPKDPILIARDGQMDRAGESDPVREQLIRNTIEVLILSLLSAESTDRKKRSEFYQMSRERQTLSGDIKDYLLAHLSEPVRLSDLSRHFSYSLSSLKRIFKEETGENIIGYLNRARLEQACVLLRDTACPVQEIARSLGFSSVGYFSNVFKRGTGKTPSQYRGK